MSRRYLSLKEIASTTRRREGLGPSLRAALEAWSSGVGIFLVIFVTSVGYIAFRGEHDARSVLNFVGGMNQASPVGEPQMSIAATALGLSEGYVGVSKNE